MKNIHATKSANRACILLAVAGMLLLGGCAATQTMISKRNLDVQTKMSATVFLDPVAPELQTVYVQVRNTSDRELDLDRAITSMISSRGYRIVHNPNEAHYMLQIAVLQVGKMDPSAARAALAGGYGGALDGAAAGVLAAAATNNTSASGYAGFGLLGAVAGTVANAAVKDVTYTMITDLQISERAPEGVNVQQQTNTDMAQGTATRITQHSASVSQWKRYRTRIVSTANKVNLDFEEARPELEHGLIRSIAGIF
ncbi:MAG: complement resistance protein TraT [Mariprofundaceae bacterium]|nr:complement resistance protein TraT [Mariprofundaceae bacterium]